LAAGLAATIEEYFGISSELVEGHDGIFGVMANNEVVLTNQGQCAKIPTDEEVLKRLLCFADLLPGKKLPRNELFPMA